MKKIVVKVKFQVIGCAIQRPKEETFLGFKVRVQKAVAARA